MVGCDDVVAALPATGSLAGRFRVFVPEVPGWVAEGEDPARAADWLREVIDALGLDRPGLVAAGGLAGLVSSFVATDGSRVDRVRVLATEPDAGELAELMGFLADGDGGAPAPRSASRPP